MGESTPPVFCRKRTLASRRSAIARDDVLIACGKPSVVLDWHGYDDTSLRAQHSSFPTVVFATTLTPWIVPSTERRTRTAAAVPTSLAALIAPASLTAVRLVVPTAPIARPLAPVERADRTGGPCQLGARRPPKTTSDPQAKTCHGPQPPESRSPRRPEVISRPPRNECSQVTSNEGCRSRCAFVARHWHAALLSGHQGNLGAH